MLQACVSTKLGPQAPINIPLYFSSALAVSEYCYYTHHALQCNCCHIIPSHN